MKPRRGGIHFLRGHIGRQVEGLSSLGTRCQFSSLEHVARLLVNKNVTEVLSIFGRGWQSRRPKSRQEEIPFGKTFTQRWRHPVQSSKVRRWHPCLLASHFRGLRRLTPTLRERFSKKGISSCRDFGRPDCHPHPKMLKISYVFVDK